MPTPPSPARTRALQILADGEWHHREELIAAIAVTVPPGKAFRNGERMRRRRGSGTDTRTRGDDGTSIAAGARDTAKKALDRLVRSNRIERVGKGYRLRRAT